MMDDLATAVRVKDSATSSTSGTLPLRGRPSIDRRGRAAFLEGAEDRSRTVESRPRTADELDRVTKR
jgi:hypothetical protein